MTHLSCFHLSSGELCLVKGAQPDPFSPFQLLESVPSAYCCCKLRCKVFHVQLLKNLTTLACHLTTSSPLTTISNMQLATICDATPLAPRSFAGGQTGKGVGRQSLLSGKSIYFINTSMVDSSALMVVTLTSWGFVWTCPRFQGRSSC